LNAFRRRDVCAVVDCEPSCNFWVTKQAAKTRAMSN
jgi:hypothetical protein